MGSNEQDAKANMNFNSTFPVATKDFNKFNEQLTKTEKQTDRQASRQSDREIDKQTERLRQTE